MDGLAVVNQAGTETPASVVVAALDGFLRLDAVTGTRLEPLFDLTVAILIVAVAYYLSKLTRQMLGRRIARRFKRPSVSRTILRGVQASVMIVAIMAALTRLGVDFSNVALSVGVFSAVVGIVLAPIIGNVLSGVFVLSEQPYEIGDMIELEDTETPAFVEDITLLYTKVFTLDNTFMVMPNGEMRQRDVINYSAEDTRIRLTLDVGVTYESDVSLARTQMEAAAREVDGVIQGGPDIRIGSARYPAAPACYIREFGDSEVLLRLRYWASEPYKQTTVRSKVLTNVWDRFEEKGIEIPYPHSHMVFDDTSGELQVAMRESDEEQAPQRSGATRRGAETEASERDGDAGAKTDGGSADGSPSEDPPTDRSVEDTSGGGDGRGGDGTDSESDGVHVDGGDAEGGDADDATGSR